MGQRGRAGERAAGQEAAPHQHLEAVADACDQAAAVVKLPQGIAQGVAQPGGQDSPRAQVVAIGEAARNGQDLEIGERSGRLEQAAHMPGLARAPASSQAAAVSSSQLVPGARKTSTRGVAIELMVGGTWWKNAY